MRKRSIFVLLIVFFSTVVVWYTYSHPTEMRGLAYSHYTPRPDDKIICIYFDDGWKSQLNALPYLDAYSFKASFAIVANYVTKQFPAYLTWTQIRSLSDSGHDIQSQTLNHKDLNTLSQSELQSEIVDVKQVFASQGYSVSTLIYPFGSGFDNATVRQLIESHYSSARRVSYQTIGWSLSQDVYAIIGFSFKNTTSFTEFEEIVNQAKGTTIVVLNYHEFDTGRDYSVTSQNFAQQMKYLHENGFKVKLLNELL